MIWKLEGCWLIGVRAAVWFSTSCLDAGILINEVMLLTRCETKPK
jgi:hypothetical protein